MYRRPHVICVAALVCQSGPALAIREPGSACFGGSHHARYFTPDRNCHRAGDRHLRVGAARVRAPG
jgi:hypothetical protein